MAILSLCMLLVGVTTILIIRYIECKRLEKNPDKKRLPGPRANFLIGLPFIGSVHQLPAKCSWLKFHEWANSYGPIYQVNLAGTKHVWISRDKIAHDLLSKRSAIYSDRPHIPALEHDNRTSEQYLPLMSKNLTWSRQRRFGKQIMDKSQQDSFYSYPELEAIRLLFELMSDPSQYSTAVESYVARITSRLAWGTPTGADELKQRARELLIGVSPTGALGNKIPAVMSLPERLSPAKAWEMRRGRTERKFFETMQSDVRRSLSNEKGSPAEVKQSWTRMFLENKLSWGFDSDLEGAYAVGMHGIAGALTIAAPMQSFCLAMCHHPKHQAILYEEIDRVLGDRRPTTMDMPEMPVLRAFIRETLRWRPPVPTGIPHALTQDDVYEGYHIPKDSVIHPLEWSISRDPDVFPDPDAWNPLRWLKPEYPTYQQPLSQYPTITQYSQFGYGRRVCQGMGVVDADLFVGIGSVAWLFSMSTEQNPCPTNSSQADSIPKTAIAALPSMLDDAAECSPALQPTMPTKLATPRHDSAISLSNEQASPEHRKTSDRVTIEDNLAHSIDRQHHESKLLRSSSFVSRSSDELSVLDFESEVEDLELQPVGSVSHCEALRSQKELQKLDHRANSDVARGRVRSDTCRVPTTKSASSHALNLTSTFIDGEDSSETVTKQCPGDQEQSVNQFTGFTPGLPGAWKFDECSSLGAAATQGDQEGEQESEEYDEGDPTLDFSTLLIAKPRPFKFDLRIRNRARAEQIATAFLEQKMQGEFGQERVFWKNGQHGDAELGWGEVFV